MGEGAKSTESKRPPCWAFFTGNLMQINEKRAAQMRRDKMAEEIGKKMKPGRKLRERWRSLNASGADKHWLEGCLGGWTVAGKRRIRDKNRRPFSDSNK